MSNFDEAKIRRANDGKFANKDAQRESAGQIDDIGLDHDPEVAGDLRGGDTLVHDGRVHHVRAATTHGDDVIVETGDHSEYRMPADQPISTANHVEETYGAGGDVSLGKEYQVSQRWRNEDGSIREATVNYFVTAYASDDTEFEGIYLHAGEQIDQRKHEQIEEAISSLEDYYEEDEEYDDAQERLNDAPDVDFHIESRAEYCTYPDEETAETGEPQDIDVEYQQHTDMAAASLEDAEEHARVLASIIDWRDHGRPH